MGLNARHLWDILNDFRSDDSDPGSIYPEGDSFIRVDKIGVLLLLGSLYHRDPADLETILIKTSNKELLALHTRLVDEFLGGATLNVIDGIVLLGIIIEHRLSSADMPSFAVPHDSASTEFFEYLQALQFYTPLTAEISGCSCGLSIRQPSTINIRPCGKFAREVLGKRSTILYSRYAGSLSLR